MKAAKDRREEFYDPARKDNNLGRNTTRLELWEEHLEDSIVALDKALKCVEDQVLKWIKALWEQGSNGMRLGGVGSGATVVRTGPVTFSGCLG